MPRLERYARVLALEPSRELAPFTLGSSSGRVVARGFALFAIIISYNTWTIRSFDDKL